MTRAIRELSPEEAPAAFRMCGEREEALWRWLAASPGGWRCRGLFEGSELLAGVVAVGQRVLANGTQARFSEIVAAFEGAPRRGLRRGGPYVELLRALFEADGSGEPGPAKDLACYWRPSVAEWGLARKLLDCEVVRTETQLVHLVDEGTRALPAGVIGIERFDHQARWLWDRCAGAFGASVIRDDAFLNWRLVDPPTVRPRILGVRDEAGVLRGYAALAQKKGVLELADWLVPPEEADVGGLLIDALLAMTREAGAFSVRAVFPDWSPWFDTFQRRGFRVFDRGTSLAARTFARRLDDLWLRDRWWTTGADFACS